MTMQTTDYYAGVDLAMPIRANKPSRPANGDGGGAFVKYGYELSAYEAAYDTHHDLVRTYRANQRLHECRVDLAEEYNITMEQCNIIWRNAWDDAHRDGMQSVLDKFESIYDLVTEYFEIS